MATSLLHRAKQGDAAAIAALINRHATGLGVVAHANLQQHCLHITLEGEEPPPKLFWSHYLRRSLHRLGTPSVTCLHVHGRAYGARRAAWEETIQLLVSGPSQTALPDSLPVTQQYCSLSTVAESVGGEVRAPQGRKEDQSSRPLQSPDRGYSRSTSKTNLSRANLSGTRSPALRRHASHRPLLPLPRSIGRYLGSRLALNYSLALQWGIALLLVGAGTAGLYIWGTNSPLVHVAAQLPATERWLVGAAIFGWVVGWAQACVLGPWVDFSDRWIPVTAVGIVAAYVGVTLSTEGLYVVLPVVALFQYLALRHWLDRAYRWILAHTAMAVAVTLALPVVTAIVTTMEWGRDLALSIGIGYELAIKMGLLGLVYLVGSAIAVGKLFYSHHHIN